MEKIIEARNLEESGSKSSSSNSSIKLKRK